MRRIHVIKIGPLKSACNICSARNYVPCGDDDIIGEYTPDMYNVFIGGVNGTLCRSCLEALGRAALAVAVDGESEANGPKFED